MWTTTSSSPADSAAQDLYVTSLRHFHFYKFDYDSRAVHLEVPAGRLSLPVLRIHVLGRTSTVISPVFSFVWNPTAATTAPPAPAASADLTMSAHEARDHLRYMVRHKAHHRATHLRSHCTRVDASSFSCRPHFRAGQTLLSRTLRRAQRARLRWHDDLLERLLPRPPARRPCGALGDLQRAHAVVARVVLDLGRPSTSITGGT